MAAILEGVRVLDFGRFIAAPYCGMILAELGAEVVRVDRPGGEQDRTFGLTGPSGENALFITCACNKKGVTLDLVGKAEDARPVLADLLAAADVVLHNFSPGAASAMGLTYEDARAANEKIVYAAISCYGREGPYARRIGFDPIAQAISGSLMLNGFEDAPPTRSQLPWVDFSTALAATIGILAALRHRDSTGEGQAVDCALLRTAVGFMAPVIAEARVFGRERPRVGNRSVYVGPSDLYACKDGSVYIATIMDNMWRRLLKAVGHEELADDPELTNDMERFERRERVDPLIARWCAARTVDEVLGELEEARIPCSRCNRPGEVADDPHVRETGLLLEVDAEAPGMEAMIVGGAPFRLSRSPDPERRRPPRPGEHNAEVYGHWLGYDEKKLKELAGAGII